MTSGQLAILDGWLAQFCPVEPEDFDTDLDMVFPTEQISADLSDMAEWDLNEVADHIAERGFRFMPDVPGCIHGWVFRSK